MLPEGFVYVKDVIPAIREEGFTIVSHAGKGAAADVVEILDRKY